MLRNAFGKSSSEGMLLSRFSKAIFYSSEKLSPRISLIPFI
jgi:hypothetical protein